MTIIDPTYSSERYFPMFTKLPILLLTLLCTVATCRSSGPPSPITVFVLDARTGEPISKVTVFLSWDEKGAAHSLGKQVTNKSGAAGFLLQEPLPERIGISFSPDEAKSCSDTAFPARDILNSGILAKDDCNIGKPNVQVQLKAGLLIVFASKVTLTERLRREIP
ncbi:MAG: hypothetical protein ACREQ5_06950 [Candidatus Dormibacteria bacterium]